MCLLSLAHSVSAGDMLTRYVLPSPASGTVKKVIEINKYLLGTMAGGAGVFYSLRMRG